MLRTIRENISCDIPQGSNAGVSEKRAAAELVDGWIIVK